MGHRDAGRGGRGWAAVACGIVLVPLVAGTSVLSVLSLVAVSSASGLPSAATGQPPEPGSSDGTLLPPADEGGVSIVPGDETPGERADERSPTRDADRSDGFDLADIDPVAALGWTLLVVASLAATVVAATRLARTLHVWRSPAAGRASGFRPAGEPASSFSLLVAAAPDEVGLGRTLDRLAALDHPAVEVLAVVGADDGPNRGAALASAARCPDCVALLVVEENVGRQRAAALDRAVAACDGEVVGVFQAGDHVSHQLLRYVDGCFSHDGADAVQGGVLPVARRWRWFTVRRLVDRYFWYRSRLHLHAQQRFMPLDETTVFVRADVLRAAGGWHRQSVAPGCDLGVRLSVNGARVLARYDPALVTRTEAAGTVRALMRDEARRVRGHLQILRSGVWRRLPSRRQRVLARSTLIRPFVDAVTGLVALAAAVAAVATGASAALTMLALLPVLPAVVGLGVEMVALADLRRIHEQRILVRDRVGLVVSALPYQVLQGLAALGALLGELGSRTRRRVSVPVAPTTARRLRPVGPVDDGPETLRPIADRAEDRHGLQAQRVAR